ncbi:MAG: amino acid adenylation domain-containing protein [Pseudomonadota bacterium]
MKSGERSAQLTVDQERIWLIHQFDRESPLYNVFFGMRLVGEFDVESFRRTFDLLSERHEPLRTTFRLVDDAPRQIVHKELRPSFDFVDLTAFKGSLDERKREAERMANAEIRRPFNLEHGPLFRVWIAREASDSHLVAMTVDHLVWDRVSYSVIRREMAEVYGALANGLEIRLPDLPLQYVDFAAWHPTWLEQEAFAKQLPYWRRQLEDATYFLDLPTEFSYPPVQTFDGSRFPFTFSAETSDRIRSFAKDQNSTINNVLLSAWTLLVARYCNSNDVIVATTSSTRNWPQTDDILGYFLTMSPLRTKMTPDTTVRGLLDGMNRTMLEALDHRDIPFGTLLDELDIPRAPSRNPLYQTSFIMVDFKEAPLTLPGVEIQSVMLDNRTAKDEILMAVWNDEAQRRELYGLIEFNTDLFSAEFAKQMHRHFETIVDEILADPERRISDISIVSEEERRHRETLGHGPDLDVETVGFHLSILEAALAHPHKVAVTCGDTHLTYAELVHRARACALELNEKGVREGERVALLLSRSCDTVVAMFAVAMVGAAYVPIDTTHPQERIDAILRDAAPALVLGHSEALAELSGGSIQILDFDAVDQSRNTADLNVHAPEPDALAYIIYTSGSTGAPKGVEVTHLGLSNLLGSVERTLDLDASDVFVAATSVSFDISGLELLGPLVRGATTVIATGDTARNPIELSALIAGVKATVFQGTPSALALLKEIGWAPTEGLKLLVGGEALPKTLHHWLVATKAVAWNMYGPTETTIWSSCWPITAAAQVSLGAPLHNTQLHVLDEHGRISPTNVPGELHIGGVGVALGYRNLPELTAERFITDPIRGTRLFRTGDMAKVMHDGTLVFLGRRDTQIKLNGFRIELDEVEHALERHPAVAKAVAVLDNHREDEVRLIAAYEGRNTDPAELRRFVAQHLPDYAVPARFGHVGELPRSKAGKIDRNALPLAPAEVVQPDVAMSPMEARIAAIWRDTLNIGRVGLRDNFFDLGGNSLQAVKLMSRIESDLGVELPLVSIFQGGTVADFARMVTGDRTPDLHEDLIELRQGTGRPVFLAHPAGESVSCYVALAKAMNCENPIYAIACPELVDGGFDAPDFGSRAALYADRIRQMQPEGPYNLFGWCYGGINALDIARKLEARDEEVSLALINSHPPYGLSGRTKPGSEEVLRGFAQNLNGDYDPNLITADAAALLTDDERIAYLQDIARTSDGLQVDISARRMRAMLEVWSANIGLLGSFDETTTVSSINVVLSDEEPQSIADTWQGLSRSPVRILPVGGNHYTVLQPPHVSTLAETLDALVIP